MTPANAWGVADPTLCAICGRDACEDHLPVPPEDPRVVTSTPPTPATSRFRICDDVALMHVAAPPCLVEGRIIAKTLLVLYGPSGKYKTSTNISLGLSMATGIDWLGARVLQHGPVVACVAEGLGRYKYRVAVAKQDAGFDLQRSIGLHTIAGAFSLLDLGAVRAFIAALRPLRPVMVSLDPLMRFMVGGDEKDSGDMARVVEACDLIQQELDTTVVLIHHTGWDESRERGSSVLRAAADTVWSQKDDDGDIILTCEKQKDLGEFAPIRLTRLVVPIFNGSACVVKRAPDPLSQTDDAVLTAKQREALTVLTDLFPDGATHAAWKKALPADYPERTLYRAERTLVNTGHLKRVGKSRPVFVPVSSSSPNESEHANLLGKRPLTS